eukprot:3096745-Amphidinium_carterae.6
MMKACAITLQVSEPSVADPGDVIQFVRSAMSSEVRSALTRIYTGDLLRMAFVNKMQDVPVVLRDLQVILSAEVSQRWIDSEEDARLKIEPDFAYRVLKMALVVDSSNGDFSISLLRDAAMHYELNVAVKLPQGKKKRATMIVLQMTRVLLEDGKTRVKVVHADPLVAIDKVIGGGLSVDELMMGNLEARTATHVVPEGGMRPCGMPTFSHQDKDERYPSVVSITLGEISEVVSEPTLGTNSACDYHSDHVLRRRGVSSSSYYKLAYLIAKEGLDVDRVACLAEGEGSVAAMIARSPRCSAVFYNSLNDRSRFTEGTAGLYEPRCVRALSAELKRKFHMLPESIRGDNDLLSASGFKNMRLMLEKMVTERGLLTLVTCDIFFMRESGSMVGDKYLASWNVGCIAAVCLESDGCLLYKAFSVVPEVLHVVLSGLSISFRSITVVSCPLSNSGSSEVYVVCRLPVWQQPEIGGVREVSPGMYEYRSRLQEGCMDLIREELSFEAATSDHLRASLAPGGCWKVVSYAENNYPLRGRRELAVLLHLAELDVPPPENTRIVGLSGLKGFLQSTIKGIEKSLEMVLEQEMAEFSRDATASRLARKSASGPRRRTTSTAMSESVVSCTVLLRLFEALPVTAYAYEDCVKDALEKRPVIMTAETPWYCGMSSADYLRAHAKALAMVYSAYSMVDLKQWLLAEEAPRQRKYVQRGMSNPSDYDDVRHSPLAADIMAEHIIRHMLSCPHLTGIVETNGGRGGLTKRILERMMADGRSFPVVTYTDRGEKLVDWLGDTAGGAAEWWTVVRRYFDPITDGPGLLNRLVVLDIPWRQSGKFANVPFRLTVKSLLESVALQCTLAPQAIGGSGSRVLPWSSIQSWAATSCSTHLAEVGYHRKTTRRSLILHRDGKSTL